MSGGNTSYVVDATAQRVDKLEPPRSLQGVEDAAVIWNTIARRFPNTAPLLCEMETVIERAEDLLQQLRTVPCTQEVDTSSSFHTPDSRESNTTISMVSDIESFAEETNVVERTVENLEEARVTVHGVREKRAESRYQRGDEQSVGREKQQQQPERGEQGTEEYSDVGYHLNSPARLDEVVQHFKTSSTKCHSSQGESDANVTDSGDKRIDISSEERLAEMMAEKSSLEGWTKVVDNALRGWRESDTDNVNVSGNNNSETRPIVDGNVDGHSSLIDGECEKTACESCGPNDIKVIKNKLQADSMAESFTVIANRRSPLAILEKYAKRCKVSIKYEYKPKANLYVINGDLCGFRAMSCAATQDAAKNELAAKILWMVAECQMNGSKFSSSIYGLSDLSREEMLEILAFHQGELKNASQKIYKFCLEKGKPAPEYSIRNSKTNQGFVYTAQCVALDYIGVGQGLRKDSAMVAAAEDLYQKYREAQQQLV